MVYGPGEGYSLPGRHESFWMETTAGTMHPPLSGSLETDVVVVGGGIAGITTAVLLKQAGHAVTLIEAGRLSQGVTGHTTAKVTSLHRLIYANLVDQFGTGLAQQYADANQAAIGQIASFVRDYSIPCDFIPKPAYTYAESPDSRDDLAAEADAARSLGLPATFVEEIPLPGRTYGAVRFDNQAQFHPVKYLLALASLIPGDGSRIYEHTRAVEVRDERGSPCTVRTENGTITAGNVVLATHYPFYDSPGFYYARMDPSRSYVLGVRLDRPTPGGRSPPGTANWCSSAGWSTGAGRTWTRGSTTAPSSDTPGRSTRSGPSTTAGRRRTTSPTTASPTSARSQTATRTSTSQRASGSGG